MSRVNENQRESNCSTDKLLAMSLKELLVLDEKFSPKVMVKNKINNQRPDSEHRNKDDVFIKNREQQMKLLAAEKENIRPYKSSIHLSELSSDKTQRMQTNKEKVSSYFSKLKSSQQNNASVRRMRRRALSSPLSSERLSLRTNVIRRQHGKRCQRLLSDSEIYVSNHASMETNFSY
uniref:uncharacterized protein LOC120347680 n=1 Tax=Styela clava TaxID=7725 RepID=UPI00193A647D|nr:uncharacterized protein LOC120347680 [Styela clava]